jgi:selenium donor protein
MPEQPFLYFDYNATTPVDPRVAEAMRPFLTGGYGNPSSMHRLGREARAAIETARGQIAACLGASPEEIVHTSGGSESNNLAICGVVAAAGGGHVITSAVEHPAVMEVVRALEAEGRIRLTVVGVDANGAVDPETVQRALAPDTVLVTVMLANNEVGTIQPVAEIVEVCRGHGCRVHTDASQAVGKIPVDVATLGVDMLTVAGHKLYAPKGVGALYVRRGVRIEPLIRGAGHETGRRAGTENVLEVVGLGAACALVSEEISEEAERLAGLRDRLAEQLVAQYPAARVHAEGAPRLPNTLSVAFPGVAADLLASRLGEEVALSVGAACHSDQVEVSPVLAAMGVPTEVAMGTVRLSVGRFTTVDEVDRAGRRVLEIVAELAGDRSADGPFGEEPDEVLLTRYTHGLGCACKLQPDVLERIVARMPRPDRTEVLVGSDQSDDACAWQLSDGSVLVQTLDFFTPVVDDPRMFGAIAAANALSDIYAMGAEPLFALNIVAFPIATLPESVLEAILAGANEVAEDAGVAVLGGHTIEDTEPKFGWVVTGRVDDPSNLWRNAGAEPGDVLVLTKPLGVGIWSTAAKHGVAPEAGWAAVQATMRTVNRDAASVLRRVGPHAVTDVTGFGLLGHLHEMLAASAMDAEIDADRLPVLAGTLRLIALGEIPGGTRSNLRHAGAWTELGDDIDEPARLILADAQTSGGLLAAVPAGALGELERRAAELDVTVTVIGRVTCPGAGRINVVAESS